jgi:4'-phosphopantetheinyl transferase
MLTVDAADQHPPPPGVGGVLVSVLDLAPADETLARAAATLTPAELDRARRGTPLVHRRRVALRAGLRAALAAELGVAPRAVPLATTPEGRPYLPGVPWLDASCSAAEDLGVVVVGRDCRVGVDLERIPAWSPDVLDEGWLRAAERQALLRLPAAARAEAATRSWTQKEAVLKARGTGLREHPRTVCTEIGARAAVIDGWEITDVPVPDGWVASLAVNRLQEFAA